MRTRITITLHLIALSVGALLLYLGWGRVSSILFGTAVAMMVIRTLIIAQWLCALFRAVGVSMRPEPTVPSPTLLGFSYAATTLLFTSLVLQFTRDL